VNYVRKLEGEVGELAKKLVTKWKDMVSADEKAEKAKPPVPLFSKSNGEINRSLDAKSQFSPELPIKLEPEDIDVDEPHMMRLEAIVKQENHKKSSSSSSSSDSSRSKHKSDNHHSSRNGHSSSGSSKDRSKEDKKSSSSSKGSSEKSKHHKSHHSSSSSHSEHSSTSKRKLEESSKENEASQKKPKLEIKVEVEIKKEPSKPSSSSNSSKHRESSSKHKEREKEKSKKVKQVEVKEEEVDGSQGMGFAEALALFDMPSSSSSASKKKDVQLADKIFKVPSSSKPSSSSSSKSRADPREDIVKKSLKVLTAPPKLLSQKPKLEPLPDIVNDLPSDTPIPEYRPAPLSSAVKDYINSSVLGAQYMKPQVKNMSDADLLTESFSSKANRTRVFSGNRVQKTVPSLFEMCIRVLQENIEFLTETGGVPFDILRPVLERAKPEQLNTIEYYNQYLLEESDVLWEPHCKRKFRSRQREENECWREMYERCTREDEEKLSRLTKNIKQQQEKADGVVQKTMLAFVDSMVKPPRNVRHKQEIYGTNNKLVVSAAARTVGLRNIQPNLAVAGDARLRVGAGLRDDAQQCK
jgi:elongin-A